MAAMTQYKNYEFCFRAIYSSSTYCVAQSPAVVDASDASLGSFPHPDTAKEKNNNCQGNTEESLCDDVMPLKCEPASEKPIDNELTMEKITEESFPTGSAQLRDLNNTKSEIYPEGPKCINLQDIPVNGSLENNSDYEVMCYNTESVSEQADSVVRR